MRINKMKLYKIITACLLISLSACSYANANATSDKGKSYLKLMVTGTSLADVRVRDSLRNYSLDHKSNGALSFGVGLGYYLCDGWRIEAVAESLHFTFDKQSAPFFIDAYGLKGSGEMSTKRETSGESLMLNAFFDLMESKKIKIFTGVGLGCSRLKETVSEITQGTRVIDGIVYAVGPNTFTSTSEVKNKFAYSLMAGVSLYATPQLDVDLMYSWKNLSSVKHGGIASAHYLGHNISAAAIYKF